jgi:Ca-activated chloride channel family protein
MRVELLTDVADSGETVYVLARLTADAVATEDRSPVNLALAIDRSSSMRGPRIAQAIRAAQQVVDKLDQRDRLSIVVFDAAARTVFGPAAVSESARPGLLAAIAAITTGVGTNLAAGMKKGAEAIRSGFVRGATSRLVLLTDGQSSVGITNPDRLGMIAEKEANRGVTITAMGLGQGFDDELLAEIARRGRGGFYYLQSGADIAAAFGHELSGVFSIAAANTEVKLLPTDDVLSVDVMHRLSSRPLDDGMLVEVGEIASNAPRQILFRLSRAPGVQARHCGTVMVTFRDNAGATGDGHILGIELPQQAIEAHSREITLERLRLAVATAVDVAWARRASGDSASAVATLEQVRCIVDDTREKHRADDDALAALIGDIDEARDAVAMSSVERDRVRRSMRERSHITLLGQSTMRRLPEEDD